VDVTEQRAAQDALHDAEARLQRAQKLQLVGQLAGGVAHDFNNLLTVILGYADMLLADDQIVGRQAIEEIFGAATRASSLARQLLAVGRRAVLAPVVFDIDATIARMDALIRQTVGESIALRLDVSADGRRVKADPHEFERVLLNLVLNARDAMPDGGAL